MKQYVKVNGNLVEANRPEIKVFDTVQEAIDALANGEINEGEIFSTKFTDTGGGDTEENIQYLADKINQLSSYVPETTGVDNPLMNEAGVEAAIDSGDTGFLDKYCDSSIVANTNKLLAESTIDNKIAAAISDAILEAKKALYPVGSIYMNGSSDTNPATLLGFGTWTRIQDYYLRASGTNATGSTGGSNTKTLTENNIPQHNHTVEIGMASNSFSEGTATGYADVSADWDFMKNSYNNTQCGLQTAGQGGGVTWSRGAVGGTGYGKYTTAGYKGGMGASNDWNAEIQYGFGFDGKHAHSLAGISYSLDFGTKTSSSYGKASPDAIAITPEYKAVAVWQRTA